MGSGRIEVGDIFITPVVTSRFRLDGGSMFGIVPRVLWEKKAPADEMNRIVLNVNSLVVESAGLTILVEAGMGNKYDRRQKDIYALEECDTLTALSRAGYAPGDIDLVILTHLHLDHAGGCTVVDSTGGLAPAFPKARFVVQEDEWRSAVDPHPLARGSYIEDDFLPLSEKGLLELVRGGKEVAKGISVELTGGHTRGHQVVRFASGGSEAIYLGDIVPTVAHLPLNWLMSWDMEPELVWKEKARLLEEASRRGALVFWSHDPETAAGRVETALPSGYRLNEETLVRASR